MKRLNVKSLIVLTAALSLSGCASTHVNNVCPHPHFIQCEALCELTGGDVSDTALNELMAVTGVMLKLREVTDDKTELGCVCK
jgi:hypothetical protein